jgi:predicted acylesterase/phospholipase RssA
LLLAHRFQLTRPLEEMELALVRAAVADPRLVNPVEEAVLRTALSLARMYKVHHAGRDVGVGTFLEPFREQVTRRLKPALLGSKPPTRTDLLPHFHDLRSKTLETRDALFHRFAERVPEEVIDRELRHKSLVLVNGGGGGTGFVYVGVMAMLDELGVKPALIAGTSIGAILGLFRSRMERFDQTEIVNIVRGLSWRKLFRAISTENRYGLPAAVRLFLRAGIGRYFVPERPFGEPLPEGSEAPGMRLKELPVPTLIAVSGIRRGMLPRPLEAYERMMGSDPRGLFEPAGLARRLQSAMGTLAELVTRPELMVPLHLGADDTTLEFDALDAAGFSSALPGVIHYDVLREDVRMREMLDHLMESKGIFRLFDGGLVDNLPAKAAWKAVHQGRIGTRNVFILALNGFASRLTTPLWLPLQRLAELTVAGNRPYAHLVRDFKRTLSPLDVVPSVEKLAEAIDLGRKQITEDVPLLSRMLAPLPRLGKSWQ